MDHMQLVIDLHKDAARQGPGGEAETRLAVTISGVRGKRDLRIAVGFQRNTALRRRG
jgi:hypothetical protein